MRTSRLLTFGMALAALALSAPACGGDSTSGASPGSKASSTTTAPAAKADPATVALAKDVALLATDYPAGWKVQTEGATRPVSKVQCEYTKGGSYAALPDGAVQSGPTMQLGDHPAFVSSRTFVFPDEPAATTFVATVDAKAWETCQAGALDDFQKRQKTNLKASVETREAEGLGKDNFESYAVFKYSHPKTPDQTVGTYSVSVFRFGRVVTMVITEQQFLEPGVQTTFDDQAYEALVKQFARANAATSTG